MNIEIINEDFRLELYGCSGIATGKDYAGTGMRLMGKMWPIVKTNGLANKGINVWVYEPGEQLFAGVELTGTPGEIEGLEHKAVTMTRYARYKHIGAYHLIGPAVQQMMDELKALGHEAGWPYLEIYSHHNADESKQETYLLMNLK